MAKNLMDSVNELQVVISNGLADILNELNEIHAKLLGLNAGGFEECDRLVKRYNELITIADYYKLVNDVTNDFVRKEVPGLGEIMDMLDILNNSAKGGS